MTKLKTILVYLFNFLMLNGKCEACKKWKKIWNYNVFAYTFLRCGPCDQKVYEMIAEAMADIKKSDESYDLTGELTKLNRNMGR